MRAVSYIRQSKKPEDDSRSSPEAQREKCEALITAKGWDIAGHFADVGKSGWDPKVRRPEFEEMMAAVRAGRVDAVVVFSLSRLTRQGARETRGEPTVVKLVPDPVEAPAVRDVAERAAEGTSAASIARKFNETGAPTKTVALAENGAKRVAARRARSKSQPTETPGWTSSTVLRILRDPCLAGYAAEWQGRPAKTKDTPGTAGKRIILRDEEGRPHTVATFETTGPSVADWERRLDDLTGCGLPFLVAELSGQVAGFAYVGPWRPKPAYCHTVEDTIYLAPDATGRGLGGALLREVIAGAARAGARQMIAVIADTGGDALSCTAPPLRIHRRRSFDPRRPQARTVDRHPAAATRRDGRRSRMNGSAGMFPPRALSPRARRLGCSNDLA